MNTKTKAEAAKSGKAQRELFDIMASSNKIDKILTLLTTQKGIPIDKVFKVEHSDECKLEKELGENYIGSYIWIGLTYDGFVVVVAKTKVDLKNRKYGDLFADYRLWGGSVTPRLIADIVASDDEKVMIKSLVSKVNEDISKAIIIIPKKENDQDNTHKLEQKIGNLLLENNIPILNKNSHNYGH